MCVLKVVYDTRWACAQALAIFCATFWLMSICEDSKPKLGFKDIGRIMETRDGQLTLQGGTKITREKMIHSTDYCQNVGI